MADRRLGRKEYDNLFKLVLLGDSCVGKSCLLVRFADDDFIENYSATIGVDFRFRSINHCNRKVKLQIWDTAGQERYRTITNAYYKGAEGIILCFDLFKKQSFDNLEVWLAEVEKHGKTDVQIVVIANKADQCEDGLEPEVSEADIAEFTRRRGIEVYRCSAKSGQNVESTFLKLTEILISKTEPNVYGSSAGEYVGPGRGDSKTLFQQKQQRADLCCGM
eukprot:Macronucleus_3249.p1 GENE.Macronucleus_3249~~Macronucleus_3249.p1  ORF type:complete len:220 (+),score=19.43 Macronucleus_3249:1-660(+)